MLPALRFSRLHRAAATQGSGGAGDFLSWSAVDDAAGYRVYWATTQYGYEDDEVIAAGVSAGFEDFVGQASADQADFTGLPTGTVYFNIRSLSEAGYPGPWDRSKQQTKVIT